MATRKDLVKNNSQQGQQKQDDKKTRQDLVNDNSNNNQQGTTQKKTRQSLVSGEYTPTNVNAEKVLKESLKDEEEPYLFSMDQIKNMLKGDNWFNTDFTKLPGNIWHTITDKDEEKGILDYSQYKEYKNALDNAEEGIDVDAVYKQMANEGVIDYDKFTKRQRENPESKPVMSKYEQAVSDIKTSFDNKLADALSPYMSGVEGSYQLNAVTKAREEMYDQYEMFINAYAGTYKDTRDEKLLKDFNNILNEYEDSIIKFTTQWAKNLTEKNESGISAYYDTLNDRGMRDYANTIYSIQAKAENKMTRAALLDSFENSGEALKNFNIAGALGEIVRGGLNTINWVLDKAGNVFEEAKQIGWGGYDVVEELANLNVYSNDAGVLQKTFGTMASWAGEILDGLPTLGPAVLDIIFGSKSSLTKATKIGEISKTAKIGNKIDSIISTIFNNKKNITLLSKVDEGILLGGAEGNTKNAIFIKNLLDDIILFDISAQQFEGRPISDNDAFSNMLFNIPIDRLIAGLSRGGRYYSPNISKEVLTSDIISDDMLKILQKGKDWNKGQGKNLEAMAEDIYMLSSIEKYNPPKKTWTKEQIAQLNGGKELVDYINKAQQEATNIWNRLTTFQDVTNRDILLSAQTRLRKLDGKSNLQALDEATRLLETNNKVIDVLRNQVRIKSSYAYIKNLVSEGTITPDALKKLLRGVRGKDDGFKDLVYTLLTSGDEKEFRAALLKMEKNGGNNVSQTELINRFNQLLGNIFKENPEAIQVGDVIGGYVKDAEGNFYDIFNKDVKYTQEDFLNKILKNNNLTNDSFNKNALVDAIDNELKEGWEGEKDLNTMFEGTSLGKLLNKYSHAPDKLEVAKENGAVDYIWRDNPQLVATDELLKKMGLTFSIEGGVPVVKGSQKSLEVIKDGLNKLNNFNSISNMDSNAWAAYKLLFVEDYATQFENIINAMKETRGEGAPSLSRDFIKGVAEGWNSPHENLYQKAIDEATKLEKAIKERGLELNTRKGKQGVNKIEGELKEEFKDTEYTTRLNADIKDSLDGKVSATQVEATAAEIDIMSRTMRATNMDDLEKELMSFFQVEVDASKLDATAKLEKGLGDKDLEGKKVMIGKIPMETAQSIVKKARSVVESMSFEGDDNKLKAFSVIGKWLAIISTCPNTATILSKKDNNFVNVLLSRILVNDEKATYVYTNYMNNQINNTLRALEQDNKLIIGKGKVEGNIYDYNKGVMELRNGMTQMQHRIDAIKNYYQSGKAGIDMNGVKEQVIANLTKLNDIFFNRQDYEEGLRIVSNYDNLGKYQGIKRWEKKGPMKVGDLTDNDINEISKLLSKKQLSDSGLYSKRLYDSLIKSFTKGLNMAKNSSPDSMFRISKDGTFMNDFKNNTSVFGVFSLARVLGNLTNEDLGASAILHEIIHQNNIKGLKDYKGLHSFIGDVAKRGTMLAEDKYLTQNMGGSFLSYIQGLKKQLKDAVLEASKKGEFKDTNSFLYSYSNEYSRSEILNGVKEKFAKDNLIDSLVSKWNNYKSENIDRLYLGSIIDNEYVTAIEELITEYRTMVELGNAGYKYANAPYILESLDILERASEIIDRFRILCIEDIRKTGRTEEGVRQILSSSFNDIDLKVSETFTDKMTSEFNKWIVADAGEGLSEGSARAYVKKLQYALKSRFMPQTISGEKAKAWALRALNEYKPENIKNGTPLTNIEEVKEFILGLDGEETLQFLDAIDAIDMSVKTVNEEMINRMTKTAQSSSLFVDNMRNSEGVIRDVEHGLLPTITDIYKDTNREFFKKKIFTYEDLSKEILKNDKGGLEGAAIITRLRQLFDEMQESIKISDWLIEKGGNKNVGIKATISGMAQSLGGSDGGYIDILNHIFKNARESIDSKKILVGSKTLEAFENANTNQELSTFITNKIVANLLEKKGIYNQEIINSMNDVMFADNVTKAISDLSNAKKGEYGFAIGQSNPMALEALLDIFKEEYGMDINFDMISKLSEGDVNMFNSKVQALLSSFIHGYSTDEASGQIVDNFSKAVANEFINLIRKSEGYENKQSYFTAFNTLLNGDLSRGRIISKDASNYLAGKLAKYGDLQDKETSQGFIYEFKEFPDDRAELSNGRTIQIRTRLEPNEIVNELIKDVQKDLKELNKDSRKYKGIKKLEEQLLDIKNKKTTRLFNEGRTEKVLAGKGNEFKPEQTLSLSEYNKEAKPYVDRIKEGEKKIEEIEAKRSSISSETAEGRAERMKLRDEKGRIEADIAEAETELGEISDFYKGVLEYPDLKGTELQLGYRDKDGIYIEGDAVNLVSEDDMLNQLVDDNIGPKFIDKLIDRYTMKYNPMYNIIEDGVDNEAKALKINYAVFYNQAKSVDGIGKEIDDKVSSLAAKFKETNSDKVKSEGSKRRTLKDIKDGLFTNGTAVDSANIKGIDNVIGTRIGGKKIAGCSVVFGDANELLFTKDGDRLISKFTGGHNKYKLAQSMIGSTVNDGNGVLVRFFDADGNILEEKVLGKTRVWDSFVGTEVSKELGIYEKIQRDVSKMSAKEFGDLMGIQNDWQGAITIDKYIESIKQAGMKKVSLGGSAIEEVLYQDVLISERDKLEKEITYLNARLDEEDADKEMIKKRLKVDERNLNTVKSIMSDIRADLPDSSWVKEDYETFKDKASKFTIQDMDKYFNEKGELYEFKPGGREKTYVKIKKVGIDSDGNVVPLVDSLGNELIEILPRKYNVNGMEMERVNTIYYYRVDNKGNPTDLIKSEPRKSTWEPVGYRAKFNIISEDKGEEYIKAEGIYSRKVYDFNMGAGDVAEDLRNEGLVKDVDEFGRVEQDLSSGEIRIVLRNDLSGETIEGVLKDEPVINQIYGTTYRIKSFTPVDPDVKFGNYQINNALEKGQDLSKKDARIIGGNSIYFKYSDGEWQEYPGMTKYYINPNTNKLLSLGKEGDEDMLKYVTNWSPYEGSSWSDIEDVVKAAERTRMGTLLDSKTIHRYGGDIEGLGDRGLESLKKETTEVVNNLEASNSPQGEIKKAVNIADDINNMIKDMTKVEDDTISYPSSVFDDTSALNRLTALTNYDILGNSEYLQHIRGTRDMFISRNKDELERIVTDWNRTIGGLSQEEKNDIMTKIKYKLDKAIADAKGNRNIAKPIKNVENNAEQLINDFIGVFGSENNKWYTDGIMRMINDTDSLENIIYKLQYSDAISMIGLNADVHNISEARDYVYNWVRQMVKTDKEAMQIAKDFVGDPLGGGNTFKLMSNVRSAMRFAKYSILSPISGTIMFMNSTLLSEPLLAGKKKIVASYLNDKAFNKILENDEVLSFLSRDNSIIENANTDMSTKDIWLDKQLKKFANFISNPDSKTKLGQNWNRIVNTVMLGGWHSLYDLWRQGEVKKVAFAQALSEMGIPESALPDLLAKLNDGTLYADPGLKRTWAQVLAKTEEFYARFFSNAGTQALSRHRFSRLWGFNFLQGYVINRTDEMLQGFRQFQKFVDNAGIGNLTWNDVTRHLAQENQELLSFMNNILASIKMGYYYEKISDNDSVRDNNLAGYFVASNDYLSSLDATWFYRLLMSPYDSIKAYKQYSERAGEEATIGGGVKVATVQLFSDICSQFFREGKFLNAIRDTLVAYGQTGDLDFAATVAGVEWDKMANSLGRFGLVDGQEKYGLEDFSQNSDIIGQMLLATDKTTRWGKEQDDMYDITNVDSIINSEGGYAAINAISKLPLIGEIIKSSTGKGGFTFSEAKYKEMMNMVENDKGLQDLYKGNLNTEVFSNDAINRMWSDFTAFNYPYKTLKSPGKHSVGSYIEGKDTTLNSMREDVFVQNICEKMGMDIEEFHNMISSDSAKKTGKLKVMAAAEAAEPGAGKIVLSYIMANDLYKLEQQYTGKDYPATADIPEDVLNQMKRAILQTDGQEMFTADKASWYKAIREYISEVNPSVFDTLYKNETLTSYVNSVGFMDMLMWDAANKGDINAKYIKNVYGVITKYMKNDDARIKAVEHLFNTVADLDAPSGVKKMAMEGILAGNIDFYNRLKNSPILSSIYGDALDSFEHRVWGVLDTEIPDDGMTKQNYKKKGYTPYTSNYGDSNKKVEDDLKDKANQYFPKSSGNGNRAGLSYPKNYTEGSIKPKDALEWYWKYYEGLIKTYSDRLVKSTGKKYPAQGTENITFKTGSNNRGSIRRQQLEFPKHKSKEYRTNVISNLPGSHG